MKQDLFETRSLTVSTVLLLRTRESFCDLVRGNVLLAIPDSGSTHGQ